ncbi:hypothetical protein C7999DRAFT_31645 [Corynascus novoguineensis]|uniref:Uncharacterized protein n=1 Tax=Corynascus novoguineensis TaxID=1126955 RepID=A0AAN7CTB8_9PEZI|nr:hypothetical protein C7999DRAFT_31645 [Corynascus novoguineensis]
MPSTRRSLRCNQADTTPELDASQPTSQPTKSARKSVYSGVFAAYDTYHTQARKPDYRYQGEASEVGSELNTDGEGLASDGDIIVTASSQPAPSSLPDTTPNCSSRLTPSQPSSAVGKIPSSIVVKVRRDMKWLKTPYLTSPKITPLLPSKYLRREVGSIDRDHDGNPDVFALRYTVSRSYNGLFESTRQLAITAGFTGDIALTRCQIRAAAVINGCKNVDIAIFDVSCDRDGKIGYIDYEELLCQMLNYGVDLIANLRFSWSSTSSF